MTKGAVGAWVPLVTQSFVRSSMGIEEARVILPANLPSGEDRLRVRNSLHPEMPVPLTVWLGRPT